MNFYLITQTIIWPELLQQKSTAKLDDTQHSELISHRQKLLDVFGGDVTRARIRVVDYKSKNISAHATYRHLIYLTLSTF